MAFEIQALGVDQAGFVADVVAGDVRCNAVQSLLYAGRTDAEARDEYERQFAASIAASARTHRHRWLRAVTPDGHNAAWAQWEQPRMHWTADAAATSGSALRDATRSTHATPQPPREAMPSSLPNPATAKSRRAAATGAAAAGGGAAEVPATTSSEAWTNFGQQWSEKDAAARATLLHGRSQYWVLSNLGTHRAYRQRGAASQLVAAGFAEADRAQLPILVHAEVGGVGLALYRKLGFSTGPEFAIDLRPLGGQGHLTMMCLIREPCRAADDNNNNNNRSDDQASGAGAARGRGPADDDGDNDKRIPPRFATGSSE